MNRPKIVLAATFALLLVFAVTPALAGKGGNGNGNGNGNGSNVTTSTAGCTVEGNVVHGYGLPVWELLNFMVTDSSGTSGWVLGFTDTGERWVPVPDRSGPTRYEFAGRTYGPDGTKYDVYASCEA